MNNKKYPSGFDADSLNHARKLVCQLEANNYEEAIVYINELCQIRDNCLFQDIGKLTRELHETLNSFNNDSRLKNMTHNEIPDARERLDFVIKKTEESAHRTLDAVENCMPIAYSLGKRAGLLLNQWHDFTCKASNTEDFDAISKETGELLNQIVTDTGKIYDGLSDVLMAQDYQDITGQILHRVIKLVQEIEQNLISMLCITSQSIDDDLNNTPVRDNSGYGPTVPGVTQGDVIHNQDDVDDLLSSLGF